MMNIVIPLFVISTIILSGYLKKQKMFVANKFYLLTFSILFLILPFANKNGNVSDVIKMIISNDYYECIDVALYNIDYVFTYMLIISFITLVQVSISFYLLEKQIRNIRSKNTNYYDFDDSKDIKIFNEKQVDKKLSLDKVFIDYCRMMN